LTKEVTGVRFALNYNAYTRNGSVHEQPSTADVILRKGN
jgi:hypothetical protein